MIGSADVSQITTIYRKTGDTLQTLRTNEDMNSV